MTLKQKFQTFLQSGMDGHVLGLFRIVFGLFMVYEMVDYFQIDLIKNVFILPKVHLGYDYLEFVQPMSEPVMNVLLGIMLVSAALITLGLFFRSACLVFATLYLYFFLIDKSLFNNHIYLFILLAFLLSWTHAGCFFSIRNLLSREKKKNLLIPRWQVFILQLQFAIVYFYGGIVKFYPDWVIRMQPMKNMIDKFPEGHSFAPLLKHDFMVPFLTYSGMLFDLAIPFLLWFKPTRIWALIPLVFFHSSNSQIFSDIGIFPFIMIFSTILFFDVAELPFLKKMAVSNSKQSKASVTLLSSPAWVTRLLMAYFIFQLLFPFRGFLLPNPIDWTSIGNRFSWRMKIQSRDIEDFTFTIQDGPAGQKIPVEINKFINTMQILSVAHDPRGAVTTAKMLAQEGKAQGMKDPVVKANIRVRWNGRPPEFTVNPEEDLSKVSYSPFKKQEWIMRMPE